MQVENMLKLNSDTRIELASVDQLDFNVFYVREQTLQNELTTITTFILAKENLFQSLKINLDTYLNFIEKIQKGYKDITYHNKTHGADLAQVSSFLFWESGFVIVYCRLFTISLQLADSGRRPR